MLKNSTKHFVENNKSIISDLFYRTNLTTTKCSGCSIKRYSYLFDEFLIFPLKEVLKFKNINNNLLKNNYIKSKINEISLYDCFDNFQKIDILN